MNDSLLKQTIVFRMQSKLYNTRQQDLNHCIIFLMLNRFHAWTSKKLLVIDKNQHCPRLILYPKSNTDSTVETATQT